MTASQRIIVLGATSAIAQGVLRRLAPLGARVVLVGRSEPRLAQVAEDLRARGAETAISIAADLDDLSGHAALVERCWNCFDGCDLLLLAYGTLPDQQRCERSAGETLRALQTNAVSAIGLLTEFANRFATQGSGTLAVISSVAGDRGRRSNYVYGSAKAALTAFTGGLRGRLAEAGVHVLTVKPGWVDTPMTASFDKGLLWADVDAVARRIVRGIEKRQSVVYTPGFWRPIMSALRAIPEPIFKHLKV